MSNFIELNLKNIELQKIKKVYVYNVIKYKICV